MLAHLKIYKDNLTCKAALRSCISETKIPVSVSLWLPSMIMITITIYWGWWWPVFPQLSPRFLNSSPSKIWGLQFRPWRRWRWWWPYRRGGEDTERMASLRAAPSCPCSSAPQVWFRLPLWCWCWCWCWGGIDVSFNLSFSIADWFLMILVTLRWQLSQTISSPTWPTSQSSSTPAA